MLVAAICMNKPIMHYQLPRTQDSVPPAAASQILENGGTVHVALDPELAGQAGQEGVQSKAAEQGQSSAADQPLEVAIGNSDFIKAADAQRVVWARVKGFPHWPVSWSSIEHSLLQHYYASSCCTSCHCISIGSCSLQCKWDWGVLLQAQILTEREAAIRLENVFRPSPLSVPVMFFGTMEIAWMAPAEIVSWADGVKANYLKKNKNRRHFLKSVEQVILHVASLA